MNQETNPSYLTYFGPTSVNHLTSIYRVGEVRCMHESKPETWEEALRELRDTTRKMNEEGYDVEVYFRNQIDEITPCNHRRNLFYFDYRGTKK